jgi:phosphatidylglycerol---prolipoprotein diacylglyceryl transferase
MHPIWFNIGPCFNVGPLPIQWFGVMFGLGFLAALLNWVILGRREGKDYTYCSDLLFWIMISGVVGARLAYVISEFDYCMESPIRMLQIWHGGLIYYGGFAGAVVAAVLFARSRKERILPLFDFIAVPIPLGHAFGRIGCFLNGCCAGIEYNGPLAVRYPGYPAESIPWLQQWHAGLVKSDSPQSLPVVPVQLFEAAFNVILYLILVWAYRHRRKDGDVASLYLMAYPIARFTFEFLRGDERMPFLGLNLDVAQIVSIGLFIVGLAIFLWPRPQAQRGKAKAGG